MNAVAVLVIACPALGLATPAAVIVGFWAGGEKRHPDPQRHRAGAGRQAATAGVRQTGTLTVGEPQLVESQALAEARQCPAGINAGCRISHPWQQRCRSANATGSSTAACNKSKTMPGKACSAAWPAKAKCSSARRIGWLKSGVILAFGVQHWYQSGYSVSGLAVGQQLLGWYVLSDTLRDDAQQRWPRAATGAFNRRC